MSLNSTEHRNPDKWHPRIRVEILLALLKEHRSLDTPRSDHWYRREAEFVKRLARAQVELERMGEGSKCA